MVERIDLEICEDVIPKLEKWRRGERMVPGLLNTSREGFELSVGFYDREQIESEHFAGRLAIAGGIEIVVIQPKVLDALSKASRLTLKSGKLALE